MGVWDGSIFEVYIIIYRSNHDEVVRAKVKQYNKTLQSQRKQVGLIAAPSSELLQAEMNLAEVRLVSHHSD